MKKIYLCIAAVFIFAVIPSSAQFEKGRIITGVSSSFGVGEFGTDLFSLGVTSEKHKYPDSQAVKGSHKGDKHFSLYLLPRAGYFVIDNLSVGLDLMMGYTSNKSREVTKGSNDKASEITLAAGPFIRYYYPLEKLYPFVQANLDFGLVRGKGYYNYTDLFSVYGIGVGAAKSLGEKVMVDALFGWDSSRSTDDDNDKYIYGSFGVRVGFSYFFSLK